MYSDIMETKWDLMQGSIKQKWPFLSKDDIAHIDGSRDRLMEVLIERYGYMKIQADLEVDRFIREFDRPGE